MVYLCHYTIVQTHRTYTTKNEPLCKPRILGDNDLSMQFINYSKCTILVWDVDNGGSYAYVRAGGIWETSVLSSQFCCETKTTLKSIKSVGNKVLI